MTSLATLTQSRIDPELLAQALEMATQLATIDQSNLWDEETLVEEFLNVKGRNSQNTRASYEAINWQSCDGSTSSVHGRKNILEDIVSIR